MLEGFNEGDLIQEAEYEGKKYNCIGTFIQIDQLKAEDNRSFLLVPCHEVDQVFLTVNNLFEKFEMQKFSTKSFVVLVAILTFSFIASRIVKFSTQVT